MVLEYDPVKEEDVGDPEIKKQLLAISKNAIISHLMNSFPESVILLNKDEMVIECNEFSLEKFNVDKKAVIGKHFGIFISCGYYDCECGKKPECNFCGWKDAILGVKNSHKPISVDYRMVCKKRQLTFELLTTPIIVGDYEFCICVLKDVANKMKLQALERIFFHDILNIAGGVRGVAEIIVDNLLEENPSEEVVEFGTVLSRASNQLIEEVIWYRDLLAAEHEDLKLNPTKFYSADILQEVVDAYSKHQVAKNKDLVITQSVDEELFLDKVIVRRIVGNMVKNALEATPKGGTVSLKAENSTDEIIFAVHNEQHIPYDVQLQIFQRFFSTHSGGGRGVGTYSMKLLGEEYLQGKVWFESTEKAGTTFFFKVNKKLPD